MTEASAQPKPSADSENPPGESADRIDAVQEQIDSARAAAGQALTDRAEEDHRQVDEPDND